MYGVDCSPQTVTVRGKVTKDFTGQCGMSDGTGISPALWAGIVAIITTLGGVVAFLFRLIDSQRDRELAELKKMFLEDKQESDERYLELKTESRAVAKRSEECEKQRAQVMVDLAALRATLNTKANRDSIDRKIEEIEKEIR